MALSAIKKSAVKTRAYTVYNEASGGLDFTGTVVGTLVEEARQEFAMRTGWLVGSGRSARPEAAGANEALLTLSSGAYRVTKVLHLRHAKADTAWNQLDVTTERELELQQGSNWTEHSDADSGTGPENHAYYRKGATQIGFYPPDMSATAGTVLVWDKRVPDVISTATALTEPPEFVPGIVYITARKMAEKDPDSDAEQRRANWFEAQAAKFVQMASGYRPDVREDS